MKKAGSLFNLTLAAMFMAIGLVLPFLTGQIQQFGNMLLPTHIPVLLCGLICGWQYGLTVGFILPLLRYMLFGMPVPFPTGIAMAFELATYGGGHRSAVFPFLLAVCSCTVSQYDFCDGGRTCGMGICSDSAAWHQRKL